MIEWNESRSLLRRAAELAAEGRTSALATVVGIQGSAYRRPGARFLVDDEGVTLGSVSGGCLEADVREVAARVIAGDEPQLLHYETGGADEAPWGLGLGCDGTVDVFVHALSPALMEDIGTRLLALLDGDEPFVSGSVVSGSVEVGQTFIWTDAELAGEEPHERSEFSVRARKRLLSAVSGVDPVADSMVFFQVYEPPPQLLICGAGDDAMPLVRYAAEAGFRVTVSDHRAAFLAPSRFPAAHRHILQRPEAPIEQLQVTESTYAVVMMHSLTADSGWISALLASPTPYIGLLGPRNRAEEILADLPTTARSRIYGPVGLDLGADGPPQVAMSILAEVLAVHSRRQPRSLRERTEPIHAP